MKRWAMQWVRAWVSWLFSDVESWHVISIGILLLLTLIVHTMVRGVQP
jgi:hypothetical protein